MSLKTAPPFRTIRRLRTAAANQTDRLRGRIASNALQQSTLHEPLRFIERQDFGSHLADGRLRFDDHLDRLGAAGDEVESFLNAGEGEAALGSRMATELT